MNLGFPQRSRGFTLIEMITVMTVIVILAGLTVAGMGFVNEKKANAKAEIDIEMLSKGIEQYKLDYGEYPGLEEDTPADGDISEELYMALFYDPFQTREDADPHNDETIYLPELDPRNSKQGWVANTKASTPPADLKIVDPWGRPYRYRKGVNAQNPDFDLWSTGKDGKTDELNPDRGQEGNRDDVRNF
ncbi:MAG: type II secretion system protein GspG [Akkermansiaceae bacterium]|nr:type II secretion system protein GspG [Akkermansiaceae bacterium]